MQREGVASRPFVVACLAQGLSYSNNLMVGPVLPLYLVSIGQTPTFIGLTLLAFSVVSFTPRPFIGQAVDRWSARGVYGLGGLTLGVTSLLYLIPGAVVLLGARGVAGLGWAAINTGGTTIAASTSPEARRGEALGYFIAAQNVARTLAPAIGLWILAATANQFALVFLVSAGLGFAGGLLALSIQARSAAPAPARQRESFVSRLIERRALLPASMFLLHSSAATILTSFVTLFAVERGIGDLGVFFIASGMAAVAATFLSRLSDRFGRGPMALIGFAASVAGLGIMLGSSDIVLLSLGGVVYQAGAALVTPTLLAMTIDRTAASRRGGAVATYSGAFQVGSGLGGLLWGIVVQQAGFIPMFLGAIALTLFGAVVLVAWMWSSRAGRLGAEAGA